MTDDKKPKIDIRAYLPIGTHIHLYFIEHGGVPANVVKADQPFVLYAELANNSGIIELKNWFNALRQGMIRINPN